MSFIYLYLDLFPIKSFRVVCHVLNVSIIMAIVSTYTAVMLPITMQLAHQVLEVAGAYLRELIHL
jgi:hypothetical protein